MAILKGDFAPPRPLGAVGDHFVDTRNWTLYGPKAKAGWPAGRRIWPDGIPRAFPDTSNDVPLSTKRGSQLVTKGGAPLLGDPPAR